MPDLTERKLLCRTCGLPGMDGYHDAECTCGDDPDGRYTCIYYDGVLADGHPFDGVPYVPCPAGCENGARMNDHGLVAFKCFACENSPVPGWVREEA